MNTRRWWDVAVILVIATLCVIALADSDSTTVERWGPAGLLIALGVLYAALLRRYVPVHIGITDDEPPLGIGIAAQFTMIALAAASIALNADMMNTLVIVLPLIWLSSSGTTQAIVMNVVTTAAFGAAFAQSQGWTPGGTVTALSIAGISTAFSVALGLWISSIASWGSERARLLAELTAAQGQLEAAHRESGAIGERERLARDIHDTIAQSLTSIVMLAERASRETDPTPTIALIEDTARESLDEARGLVAANAPVTASAPLERSLTRLGERFARETGMRVETRVELAEPLPREREVMLLRCVQEGLANVRKHARADHVAIMLRRIDDEIRLTVTDDGCGLGGVTIDDERGFGLSGMRERVGLVGGTLSVTDAASGRFSPGTILCVTVPAVDRTSTDGAAPMPASASSIRKETS